MNIVTQSNSVLAERISPHRNGLISVTALSLKNIDASVKEIDRTSSQGFRTVLLYPHVEGENNIVFGSDYCGGLGPLSKGFSAPSVQSNPESFETLWKRILASCSIFKRQ
jgi:hypothetical protein